jgi:hypothetical protein
LLDGLDLDAAVWAEFCPGKHHSHAVGAGDRLQQGVAILTLRRIFLDGSAAFGTIQCADFHAGDFMRNRRADEGQCGRSGNSLLFRPVCTAI